MIYGERIRMVRELAGKTQSEFADDIEVSQGAVAQFERGEVQPAPATLERLSARTGFPSQFFERPLDEDFSLGSLVFRSLKSMTARERKRAHRYGQLTYQLVAAATPHLRLPDVRLPRQADLEQCGTPEDAAALTRATMGLSPDAPVKNVIAAIERAGVVVLSVPVELPKSDAFSLWTGPGLRRPVIVILGSPPGDRLRFTVAHELGHLVLHGRSGAAPLEEEAHRFGGAFLVPSSALAEELPRQVTLSDLGVLKERWGVSIASLIMIAHRAGLIDGERKRRLFQLRSAYGWTKREPGNVPVERPAFLGKMLDVAYGTSDGDLDYGRLAAEVAMDELTVRRIASSHRPGSGNRRSGSEPTGGEVVTLEDLRSSARERR